LQLSQSCQAFWILAQRLCGGEHAHAVNIAQEVSVGQPILNPSPHGVEVSLIAVMSNVMRWSDSPVQRGRPAGSGGPNANANRAKHKKPPPNVVSEQLSAARRRGLIKAIKEQAKYLRSCWRPNDLHLPEFIPRPPQSQNQVVDLFMDLWDWQDQCMNVMRQYRQVASHDYDYNSFEVAFGSLSRLTAIRGSDFAACQAALAARSKSVLQA
jgi:hypothetical protein